jgi:ABC-type Na+ transport system ATPase subunit NatA
MRITPLRNNSGTIDADTCAAPSFRHEPTEKRAVALRVVGLARRYGTTTAVSGLDFEIGEGEIFGLLGPNGAGKTTTIAMLATQRRPSSGDATLFGHSACNEQQLVRQMLGLAPQEVSLYPALTAAENLQFFGSIYGVRQPALRERIDELLALVGLDAHRDHQVGIFSGGMKRRLNLAVSLVHRPKLILLDEPTAGVDPQSREQILKIIGGLRDDGNAILYTTHWSVRDDDRRAAKYRRLVPGDRQPIHPLRGAYAGCRSGVAPDFRRLRELVHSTENRRVYGSLITFRRTLS